MVKIILESSDGRKFPVEVELAKKSNLLKVMLDDLGVNEDASEEVPIKRVRGDILEKILVWIEYHQVPTN